LHAEIVRFVDILLVLHHPAIHERTHYFCELIILHMSYIFSGVVDPEVLAILLEIIYHELMTHSNCNIKDLIINSPIGEALDNLAVGLFISVSINNNFIFSWKYRLFQKIQRLET
jgi:hypothetical protein